MRPLLLSSLAGVSIALLLLAGCSGGVRSISPAVISTPDPDFSIAAAPGSVTLAGISSTPTAFTVAVTPINGFSSSVTVHLPAPAGITCAETNCSAIATTQSPAVLHITAAATGVFSLPFTGTSGALSHTVTASLTVSAPPSPDFAIDVTPATASVAAGSTTPLYSFTITPLNGFAGAVNITSSQVPGFTCVQTPCSVTSSSTSIPNAFSYKLDSSLTPATQTMVFTATSGSLSHSVSTSVDITPAPVQDFAFAVTPTSATVTAGNSTPLYSFTITPQNGFSAPVTIAPASVAGFTCQQNPCTITSSASSVPNAFGFQVDPSVAPGVQTLTFNATSGSLRHTATTTVTVVAQPLPDVVCSGTPLTPTSPQGNTTAFFYTGSKPKAAVYDADYNVIFVSDQQLNRILVLSPNTQAVLGSIPVIQPEGLDITADGKMLIVGTDSTFFYRIAIPTLCVVDRPELSISASLAPYPLIPRTLSNGSILFEGAYGSTIWSASNGNVADTYGTATVRSGDHTHLVYGGQLWNASTGAYNTLNNLDVTTGKATQISFPFGTAGTPVAVNADGSRIYVSNGSTSGGVTLYDGAWNVLAKYTQDSSAEYMLSEDGSRLYVIEGYFPYIAVLDASTLKVLGYTSAQQGQSQIGFPAAEWPATRHFATDGTGRLLSWMQDTGLGLLRLGPLASGPSAVGGQISSLSNNNGGLGLATKINFYAPSSTVNPTPPTVTGVAFGEANNLQPIPFAVVDTNDVNVTAPFFASGCADINLTYNNTGASSFTPRAFCYTPFVAAIDGDAGPSDGGGKLTIYGKGFGPHPTVLIGNTPATSVTAGNYGVNSVAIQSESLTVVAPPGSLGSADITITSGTASTTLPSAYTYYNHQDGPLASGASPFQLVYDARNDRLLWTDNARNLLIVASASTAQTQQEIQIAAKPLGLALSPDGTSLAIAFAGDNSVRIYDSHTFTQKQSAITPIADFSTYVPYYPGFLNDGTVIVGAAWNLGLQGAYGSGQVFTYNLSANTLSVLGNVFTAPTCENITDVVASADGSQARVGNKLYSPGTKTFTPLLIQGFCTQVGISADGVVNADPYSAHNNAGKLTSFPAGPQALFGSKINTGLEYFDQVPEEWLVHPSGGLGIAEYVSVAPTTTVATDLREFDLNHGDLVRTLEFPDGLKLPFGGKLIAADPAGKRLWVFTTKALFAVTLPSDPLTIGEIQTSGSALTVLGTGFAPNIAVAVDGVTLPVNVSSSTSLTSSLPLLGKGTHFMTFTNPGGSAYKVPVAITIP